MMVVYTSKKCNFIRLERVGGLKAWIEIGSGTRLNGIDFMNGYDYIFYVG